jgi:hypothetical protein
MWLRGHPTGALSIGATKHTIIPFVSPEIQSSQAAAMF